VKDLAKYVIIFVCQPIDQVLKSRTSRRDVIVPSIALMMALSVPCQTSRDSKFVNVSEADQGAPACDSLNIFTFSDLHRENGAF
jgi:hypothetical protein